MKKIKIDVYGELETLNGSESEFIIDLEDCSIPQRKRIMDFFVGMTVLPSSIKKISNHEFKIELVQKTAKF